MPSIVKSNTTEFLKANQEKRAQFLEAVRKATDQEEQFWMEKIRREQMSFPRGGPVQAGGTRLGRNPGGQLRRNWFNQAVIVNQSVKAQVWSTTPYAPIHEEGGLVRFPGGMRRSKTGKSYQVRPYWVHYIKRLHIGESWEKDFLPMQKKRIDAAAAQFLR